MVSSPGKQAEGPTVFGFELPNDPKIQLAVLASCQLSTSLGFAYLQEYVTILPGFKYQAMMTFLTMLVYTVMGATETILTKGWIEGGKRISISPRGKWMDYFICGMLVIFGTYFTNQSLKYITYPTRIVFKSCKVIPVMMIGVLWGSTRFSLSEWRSAGMLVVGICLFTLGDINENPSFDFFGVGLVSIGVCLDAVTGNFEKERFFRGKTLGEQPSQAEFMCNQGYFGTLAALLLAWVLGQTGADFWNWLEATPEFIPRTLLFSALGYYSVWFTLSLIRFVDPASAEVVKSLRKVGSIIISFIAYGRSINLMYGLGFAVVVVSCVEQFNQQAERRALQMKKETAQKTEKATPKPNREKSGGSLRNRSKEKN